MCNIHIYTTNKSVAMEVYLCYTSPQVAMVTVNASNSCHLEQVEL